MMLGKLDIHLQKIIEESFFSPTHILGTFVKHLVAAVA
jgi:hypothetical protein